MIKIKKKKINISKELKTKIEWACKFNKTDYQIIEGCLRVVEHTNLAYVEPHRAIINNTLYLFFNEHEFFYIGSLNNKKALSTLNAYISENK